MNTDIFMVSHLSDNIHKVWDPFKKGTVFANSLICQPRIPRTAFFTTKLIFKISFVPVFPKMLDKSIL